MRNRSVKLNVPITKQTYRVSCGPAAMSAVYKFFAISLSEKDIIKRIGGLTEWGSFTTDHALLARELGFNVILHSYNLEYFSPEDFSLSKKDMINKISSLIKKEKREYNKRELKSIKKALETQGIIFEFKIPSISIIKKLLDKKLPVMLGVNSAVLFDVKKDLKMGHFIILSGYNGDEFFYNDVKYGKRNIISADKLLFALSNNVFDSSAYLLVINPKST